MPCTGHSIMVSSGDNFSLWMCAGRSEKTDVFVSRSMESSVGAEKKADPQLLEERAIKPSALQIGKVTVDPPLILAPMAGVTDRLYRRIMADHGAGMVTTEMVSTQGLIRDQGATWRLCAQDDDVKVPMAVQLFGGDSRVMAEAARRLEDKGVRLIDINAGCPVKKVVKQGAGAVLLKTPDRLARMVESVKASVSVPVTVKVRLGWDENSINVVDAARMLERAGVDAITVHGRTAAQFYGGQARWEWIRRVKEAVGVPVVGNGDITSPALADAMLRQTGCDAVMIGRATQGNPWLLSAIIAGWREGTTKNPLPDWMDFQDLVEKHVNLFLAQKPQAAGHIRKIMLWYSRHCPGAAALRNELTHCTTVEAMVQLFRVWVEELQHRGLPFMTSKVPEHRMKRELPTENGPFNCKGLKPCR